MKPNRERQPTNLYLSQYLVDKMKTIAALNNKSLSLMIEDWMKEIIEEYRTNEMEKKLEEWKKGLDERA